MKLKTPLLLLFDFILLTLFVCIIAYSYASQTLLRQGDAFAIIFLLIGITMIFSRKYLEISRICYFLNWVSIYMLNPRTKYNHYIFGFLISIFSFALLLTNKNTIESDGSINDPTSFEEIIFISLIILANILVALSKSNNDKKK